MTTTMGKTLIRFSNIYHQVNQRDLFYDLEGSITLGDKIALIGHNGSGKSTFLKILMGRLSRMDIMGS